jgi:hypothetical protein
MDIQEVGLVAWTGLIWLREDNIKMNIQEVGRVAWTGLIWLKIGTVGRLL